MRDRYQVQFLDKANLDLADARSWLLQPGSGARSHKRYADIIRALQDLETRPDRWPVGDHEDTRERSVSGYRLVYRLDDNMAVVIVLRLFGPSQDRTTL